MKPDQNVVCYMIEVIESFPEQLPSDIPIAEDSQENSKILQVATRCFLTYTFSSLKEAIAAGAWLYGIEENRDFYMTKQVKEVSWIEIAQVPHKMVRFGSEALWESHLSIAEKVCGGDCATDALSTQNQEIIQAVGEAILKKGFLFPQKTQEKTNAGWK